jgi:hypothetical protein
MHLQQADLSQPAAPGSCVQPQLPGTGMFLRDLYHTVSQGEQERLQLGVNHYLL